MLHFSDHLLMSSIHETIKELQQRLDDLEKQTSKSAPFLNHGSSPNYNLKILIDHSLNGISLFSSGEYGGHPLRILANLLI